MSESETGEGKVRREPRMILYVDATMYEEGDGYRPVFVKEGETGYYPQGNRDRLQEPWYFGHDLDKAKERCAEYNQRLGVSPEEARRIVFFSLFGSEWEEPAR